MTAPYRTPNELRRAGFAALTKALGPVDAIRFLQQFDPGAGDYTAVRGALLGSPTVDELLRELRDRNRDKT
jgi:hypothetical protein